MSQKSLYQKLRQVALTYLTWRWTWLILPLSICLMLGTAFNANSQHDASGVLPFFAIFGLALPIFIGMQWFVAVAKWQFADPRARLMPNYRRPHLVVIFAVLVVMMVANPLFQAFCQGISPLGPLAFALLLGGLFLYAIHFNQGIAAVPMMAVFLSIMHPATSHFWISGNSNYLATHAAMAIVGAALTAWWLWKLATLHEEDEAYSVTPIGALGSLSRLERVLQGRLQGRRAARKGLGSSFSDRWHDRLLIMSENPSPMTLSQYGWGRFPLIEQAVAVALGIPLYAFGLDYLGQWFGGFTEGMTHEMVYAAAFALPALVAAFGLQSHRVRMASELLRPANRTAYFDGLFQALAKRSLFFWLAMYAGSLVVFGSSQIMVVEGDAAQLIAGYTLLSLTVQLPAFAIGLRMAQWRSPLLFGLGCYVLGHLEVGLLLGWVFLQKDYGPIPTALLGAILLVALGAPLLTSARNAWQRTELA